MFDSEDEALRCLRDKNHSMIGGKQIFLGKRHQTLRNLQAQITVSGIPLEIDQKELFNIFEKYGPIQSNRLDYNQNGKHTGRGYVLYECQESAQKAI